MSGKRFLTRSRFSNWRFSDESIDRCRRVVSKIAAIKTAASEPVAAALHRLAEKMDNGGEYGRDQER
jgi:hypothetical protein